MSTTHAVLGLLLAAPLAVVAPELATVGGLAAMTGGVFPDLDVLVGDHRKTLHYPDYYWLVAVPAAAVAWVDPGPVTVAVAYFALSAAVHSVTDVVGGGLGLRPWEFDDDRGVYLHVRKRWIRPRRWIRYDGAPEDLALAAVLSAPALVAFDGVVARTVVAGLALSVVYTLLRKRLPDLAPDVFT